MPDFNSALPIRSEADLDQLVITRIADKTNPSQTAAVDTDGNIQTDAKLHDGLGNAITSQANGSQHALDVGINVAGVQIDPRQTRALTSSDIVTANQGAANTEANAWPVKVTDGTNTLVIGATGELNVQVSQPLPAGTNNIGTVEAKIHDASGNAFTVDNPLPVVVSNAVPGDEVLDHVSTVNVAAAASTTHSYTVTVGKTLTLQQIAASASGKIKVEIKIGANRKVVLFNSTSNPNVNYIFSNPQRIAAGTVVSAVITNLDKQPFDVFSTIEGVEN